MHRRFIPLGLIVFRFALAPVLLVASFHGGKTAAPWLAILLLLGVASDIFDGIIARRLGCATDKLRRLDSQTDAVFWLAVLLSTILMDPAWLRAHILGIALLLMMEAACYLFSFWRFRRETCTHSYLSKAWGLALTAAFTALWLGSPLAEPLWCICVVLGLVSQLEVLAILALLPHWQRDIPNLLTAWRIRRGA